MGLAQVLKSIIAAEHQPEVVPARPRNRQFRVVRAKGYVDAREGGRRLVVRVDDETFDRISARAAQHHVSTSEMIRRLLGAGLSRTTKLEPSPDQGA